MEISSVKDAALVRRVPVPYQQPEPVEAKTAPLEDALIKEEEKKPPVDVAQATLALAEINSAMQTSAVGVRFEFDNTAEKMVTKVVDAASGELIRQIPTKEVLRMTESLDKLQGLLVNQAV